MEIKVYQIHGTDNVATALTQIAPGTVWVQGSEERQRIAVREMIPEGHKISLKNIKKGEKILKYGVAIGRAFQDIPQGSWVRLHNIQSLYDQRSQNMDVKTGAPKDTKYE